MWKWRIFDFFVSLGFSVFLITLWFGDKLEGRYAFSLALLVAIFITWLMSAMHDNRRRAT